MPDFGVHIGKSMGKLCKSQIQTARAPKGQPPLCGITAIEHCAKRKSPVSGLQSKRQGGVPLYSWRLIAGLCGPLARAHPAYRAKHAKSPKCSRGLPWLGGIGLLCAPLLMQGYGKAFRAAQNKQGTGRFPVRKKPGSAIKQSPARETDLCFSYFAYSTARLSRITFTLIWPG